MELTYENQAHLAPQTPRLITSLTASHQLCVRRTLAHKVSHSVRLHLHASFWEPAQVNRADRRRLALAFIVL